ncbi:MAG: hypothetical protein LBI79_02900 [Nitrososphaerota archaeon]|jgi:hypothetical protein|nr:hypothetical protein [Nitrososphaerota archaeon]
MRKFKLFRFQKSLLALSFLVILVLSTLPFWMLNAGTEGPLATAMSDTPYGVDGRILSANMTGDVSDWIEIAKCDHYSLIVRKNYINIYSGTGHYDEPTEQYAAYSKKPATNNYLSNICLVRTYINAWFNGLAFGTEVDNLPADAKLRNYTMQNNATKTLGTSNNVASLNDGFSQPTATQASTGNNIAFALSFSESAEFLSITHEVKTLTPTDQPSNLTAITNYGKITIPQTLTHSYGMWLRSPGDTPNTAGALSYTGRVSQYPINPTNSYNERGFIYPALWVNSDIFEHL